MKKQPKWLRDFLIYLTAIKGKSKRTRDEYEYDLTLFFRFLYAVQEDLPTTDFEVISIAELDIDFVRGISLEDMYLFLAYCEEVRQNSAATRARKVATLKSFFKYLKTKKHLIDENPAEDLETPKINRKQPVYLKVPEAKQFLSHIPSKTHYYRDHCMMTFLLNLGLRATELCRLSLGDVEDRYVTIVGKGGKERRVYMNDSCVEALALYIEHERKKIAEKTTDDALFLSQKGNRLTRQRLAKIVKQINDSSALHKANLTPHKLRHTSATIMYQNGADIRSLQQILGHSNISTTQIYTHVEDEMIKRVFENNPLNIEHNPNNIEK